MAKRLLVGTRKGLFVFEPEASSRRWRMCQQHFPGKTVTAVLDDRRSTTVTVPACIVRWMEGYTGKRKIALNFLRMPDPTPMAASLTSILSGHWQLPAQMNQG